MKMTVLVPTYRRPKDLERCLKALQQQIRSADEAIVVVRDTDRETCQLLDTLFTARPLPLQTLKVTIPGQVNALNIGLEYSTGDIIAITDDDAAPHPDWLERIEAHFLADERVGGVGGRDYMYFGNRLEDGAKKTVGKISWFGRAVGNHHLGFGTARAVDVLKGANMSYRRTAIEGLQFDNRLRGSGAQVHNDLGFSLTVKNRGWKLIYDPAVAVDHYPAQRFDEDQRHAFNAIAWANRSHNETVELLDYLILPQKIVYSIWAVLVGTREVFGFIQLFRFLPTEKGLAAQKWWASVRGRWQGLQTWIRTLPKKPPSEEKQEVVAQ
jgi:cellulose synthase/poly-beta-1,6-N-acetylglucosamine synthase-like glycosyltransferase